MDMNVSDEAVKATTKCNKEFECLKTDGACVCKVDHCVGGTVHFVENRTHNNCPYNRAFGFSRYCNCPVRKELFNKHKI